MKSSTTHKKSEPLSRGSLRPAYFKVSSSKLTRYKRSDRPKRSFSRLAVVCVLVFFVAFQSPVANAATSEKASKEQLQKEIDELEAKIEANEAQQEAKAVDTQKKAERAETLTVRLERALAKVSLKKTRLSTAQEKYSRANENAKRAAEAVGELQEEVTSLEGVVAIRAVDVFIESNSDAIASFGDAGSDEASTRQTLVQTLNGQGFDEADQLKNVKAALEDQETIANKAEANAAAQRDIIATQLEELEVASEEAAELAAEAEAALDNALFEAAILAENDSNLSKELDSKIKELQANSNSFSSSGSPAPANPRPGFPSSAEIVQVEGYWVHIDIAKNLQNLLIDARADGVNFGGWAFRSHEAQIGLRRAHCGTSEWAIWQKSSSSCSPPTARPGNSQHEQGKAIDFTYNGSTIGSRTSPGYRWLAANAADYGFYNLPSEPWHWSVNGR